MVSNNGGSVTFLTTKHLQLAHQAQGTALITLRHCWITERQKEEERKKKEEKKSFLKIKNNGQFIIIITVFLLFLSNKQQNSFNDRSLVCDNDLKGCQEQVERAGCLLFERNLLCLLFFSLPFRLYFQ
jgi:hypothetical protein